jgi:hypothetical protein
LLELNWLLFYQGIGKGHVMGNRYFLLFLLDFIKQVMHFSGEDVSDLPSLTVVIARDARLKDCVVMRLPLFFIVIVVDLHQFDVGFDEAVGVLNDRGVDHLLLLPPSAISSGLLFVVGNFIDEVDRMIGLNMDTLPSLGVVGKH